MTKSTSTNARLSEFDAYVALAWMIIDYGHVEAILEATSDDATSNDAFTSPSDMTSDDTQVCGGEGLGRGMVLRRGGVRVMVEDKVRNLN